LGAGGRFSKKKKKKTKRKNNINLNRESFKQREERKGTFTTRTQRRHPEGQRNRGYGGETSISMIGGGFGKKLSLGKKKNSSQQESTTMVQRSGGYME